MRRLRNFFFEFYALLATRFSLRLRLVRRREVEIQPTDVRLKY